MSLLGEPLYQIETDPETVIRRIEQLGAATDRANANPDSEADLIWVGRRMAYLGAYQQAIEVYTRGLEIHPDSYRIRRHRGHRSLSIRQFDDAIADLKLAAELSADAPDAVEPDGMPNRLNIPTSTDKSNIYYHLGLAHYLRAEFDAALEAYRQCMAYSTNNDMRCATTYWLYLTLRRLDRDAEARQVVASITADMALIENHAYHELLLMFKGELTPQQVLQSDAEPGPVGQPIDDATRGYGVGVWHLVNGRVDSATDTFREVVHGTAWPAFGHIAAEAELARRPD